MKTESPFQQVGAKAKSNGIEIYYETFGKPENPAVLLIMGLDCQCVMWSMDFIEPLVAAGYYVIRFDNRDIGLSTWMNDWNKKKLYTLEDIARDAIGLLDAINIPKAHIIGASMGGMIAQRIALSHAEKVLSLTSIMSSGYALNPSAVKSFSTKIAFRLMPYLVKKVRIKNKILDGKVTVDSYLATYKKVLAGTKYPFNEAYFRKLFSYSILERKGQNPKARYQQLCAIVASGSRLKELPKINVPTLILHGTADKLVPPIHAKIYAPLIPNAKMVWLEGVGHEIPTGALPQVHEEILALFK
ncbi:MAG: alpha/beta hydrolase [Spirosomaceae bacterium]|nr:alpha/beta hydrolase [Spirosomataceae bacterium]